MLIRPARIRSASYRPRTEAVDTLVLHYTALDFDASMRALRDGAVSVHYLLDVDGSCWQILNDDEVGWHAGLSCWQGRRGVNARSIGIEIVNLDGNRHPYPPAQVAALIALCRSLLDRHPGIAPSRVVGHSDIAPRRKVDPGRLFPWRQLARAGIGLWPSHARGAAPGTPAQMQALLTQCGYPMPHAWGLRDGSPVWVDDPAAPPAGVDRITRVGTADILRAFQLRFEPENLSGTVTPLTMGRLRRLARLVEAERAAAGAATRMPVAPASGAGAA